MEVKTLKETVKETKQHNCGVWSPGSRIRLGNAGHGNELRQKEDHSKEPFDGC